MKQSKQPGCVSACAPSVATASNEAGVTELHSVTKELVSALQAITASVKENRKADLQGTLGAPDYSSDSRRSDYHDVEMPMFG